MLDQLIKLAQQNAGETILMNPEVPQKHKDGAVIEVAHQIFAFETR
jgi:hypothetical protein